MADNDDLNGGSGDDARRDGHNNGAVTGGGAPPGDGGQDKHNKETQSSFDGQTTRTTTRGRGTGRASRQNNRQRATGNSSGPLAGLRKRKRTADPGKKQDTPVAGKKRKDNSRSIAGVDSSGNPKVSADGLVNEEKPSPLNALKHAGKKESDPRVFKRPKK